eukprot:4813820-Amphidinium_carterae.1
MSMLRRIWRYGMLASFPPAAFIVYWWFVHIDAGTTGLVAPGAPPEPTTNLSKRAALNKTRGVCYRARLTHCGDLLHRPVRNVTVRTFRNMPNVDLPAGARPTHAHRMKVLCYLRGLLDPCQVPCLTRPGRSLQSYLLPEAPSCAIVSNSGVMANLSEGDHIDSRDVVMRFNNGLTKRFHTQVGQMDHIRFVNMHFARMVLRGEWKAKKKTLYVRTLPTGLKSEKAWDRLIHLRPDLLLFGVPDAMVVNVEVALRLLFSKSAFVGQ